MHLSVGCPDQFLAHSATSLSNPKLVRYWWHARALHRWHPVLKSFGNDFGAKVYRHGLSAPEANQLLAVTVLSYVPYLLRKNYEINLRAGPLDHWML
jgi:hypothetical protein